MRRRLVILIVGAMVSILAIALGGVVYAQEDVEVECFPPPCDGSLDLENHPGCLYEHGGETLGGGVLIVRNTGEQGTMTVTLRAFFTEDGGNGSIDPDEVTLGLEPSELVTITYGLVVSETKSDGSVQIRWECVAASCRPCHNVDKGVNGDHEECTGTIVELVSFTAQSEPEEEPKETHWSAPFLGGGSIAALLAFFIWAPKRRNRIT